MRWIFFSPVVFILFGAICFYVGIKLLGFIRYFSPKTKAGIFWIPFIILCCMVVLLILFRSQFRFLRQFGSIWITVFLYIFILFSLLVMTDILKLILYLAKKLPKSFNVYATGCALVICFGLIVYGASNARLIETVNYQVNINKAERKIELEKLRIALISDTHIGYSIGKKHIKRVVDEINRAKPDLVCIAGDIFDSSIDSIKDIQGILQELRKINSPLGVYACLGNHDSYNRSTERIVQVLNDAGIIVLQDESFVPAENLYIIGRKDLRPIGMEGERKSSVELIRSAAANPDSIIILMDHRPAQFKQMERLGIDILLSGHTHNGQIFPGKLLTNIIFKNAGGIGYGHWQGDTMHAIVTSGAGFWGPSIRLGTISEIAVIDINIEE